ncbi:MAG: aconitate hydratase AcnA [Burkholderiales bacterium]|nr:aconitate hydratase AcnA [Burkholderiales bacterium]
MTQGAPTGAVLRALPPPHESIAYCDLAAALARRGGDAQRLPYCLRVVAENLARHLARTGAEGEAALAALARWPAGRASLPLFVSRVILPDSSGVPALLDLAALRDAVGERGGDPTRVRPGVPVDLVIDHSLQVDVAGSPLALRSNLAREFERNAERYRFVKWAQSALGNVRVFPPGTGIIHQVNLEHVASVVSVAEHEGRALAFPDFVIGGDSHTPMVNGIGVLGWGVGGIDAEALLLGYPADIAMPEVVGVEFVGTLPAGTTTTDLVLLVTQRLRAFGVTGKFVEFFGPAVAALPVPHRATLANMAPEYGATIGFFPVDARTLEYLRATGRSEAHVARVEAYCKANALWRSDDARAPDYSAVVTIDFSDVVPTLAGPRRPQDRLPLPDVAADFRARLARSVAEGGFATTPATAAAPSTASSGNTLPDGAVVIAAITSCTNTSNPSVMLAAGLLARNAVARGLRAAPWVKTSLAPGSQVVTRYLEAAGLTAPLAALGFDVVGYGCTTCAGKSGPLAPDVVAAIERDGVVAAAVLSGNRNFEGRIHRLVRANYLASPPLVVAYAIAGRIDIDLTREPLGHDPRGAPVFLADLWPAADAIAQHLVGARDAALYRAVYADAERGPDLWRELEAPRGARFAWDPASSYLVAPPFVTRAFAGDALPERLPGARVLAAFGDSLTTDHISPSGEIPADSAAGRYLVSLGIAPKNFNTYVGRRGNHEVMLRGTFANVRIRNLVAPGSEGGVTRLLPEGRLVPVHEAARAYRERGVPLVVLGGRDYGQGSSRDWAAKGTALLGVRAVIAESFERIHRANLISMGVVPLRFAAGQGWRALGLTGEETLAVEGLRSGVLDGAPIDVVATRDDTRISFTVTADVQTAFEQRLLAAGGMLPAVLDRLLDPAPERTGAPALSP